VPPCSATTAGLQEHDEARPAGSCMVHAPGGGPGRTGGACAHEAWSSPRATGRRTLQSARTGPGRRASSGRLARVVRRGGSVRPAGRVAGTKITQGPFVFFSVDLIPLQCTTVHINSSLGLSRTVSLMRPTATEPAVQDWQRCSSCRACLLLYHHLFFRDICQADEICFWLPKPTKLLHEKTRRVAF
jgi:hypothetical protein